MKMNMVLRIKTFDVTIENTGSLREHAKGMRV